MAKRWKKDEITYLKRYATQRTLEELAERFKTDTEAVDEQLRGLGLAAKGSDRARYAEDPAVADFQNAIEFLHKGNEKKAKELFEKAALSSLPEVVSKARLYLRRLQDAEVSPSDIQDPYLRAVYEKNSGDLDAALALAKWGGRWDEDSRFAYLAATILAAQGEADEARERLSVAIELAPELEGQAAYEPELADLVE